MLERIDFAKTVKVSEDADGFSWFNLSNPSVDEILECNRRWNIPLDFMSVVLDSHEISRAEGLDRQTPDQAIMLGLLYPINDFSDPAISSTPDLPNDPGDRFTKVKKEKKKRHLIQESGTYSVRLLSIIWLPGLLLTVTPRQLNIDELLTERRQPDFHGGSDFSEADLARLEPELFFESPEDIIALLIWEINRQFIQATRILEQRREHLQRLLAHSGKTEILMAISQLQESLVRFETAADENREVIMKLADFEPFALGERQSEWLNDILTESHQAEKMIGQEAKMLQQLNETFSAIISNNLNVTMKILTSLTIIITIPTIIGGLWGMNVALPFEDMALAFWILIALSLFICLVVTYILHKKDLL